MPVDFDTGTILTTQRQHGIPISVKEHVSMKNRTCNTGYVAWWVLYHHKKTTLLTTKNRVDEVATEDAFLLQLLSKAGAIFHVRTNEPQSLMVCPHTSH